MGFGTKSLTFIVKSDYHEQLLNRESETEVRRTKNYNYELKLNTVQMRLRESLYRNVRPSVRHHIHTIAVSEHQTCVLGLKTFGKEHASYGNWPCFVYVTK